MHQDFARCFEIEHAYLVLRTQSRTCVILRTRTPTPVSTRTLTVNTHSLGPQQRLQLRQQSTLDSPAPIAQPARPYNTR